MPTTHADYRLSQLDELEAESIHIFREVAAEFEKPVLMFSGGKDSIVHAAARGEGVLPRQDPVPRAPGRHRLRLPGGPGDPRQLGEPARRPAGGGLRRGGHRQRCGRRRRQDLAQPAADRHAPQRHRGGGLHRRVRRRSARRGEGPGQGAGLLPPRRLRSVGPEEPAARAVVALQRQDPRRRAHAHLPAVELDRARHLALHRAGEVRDPVDLLLAQAQGVRARRHAALGERVQPAQEGRDRRGADGAVPHRRRPDAHRLRGVARPPTVDEIIEEIAIARVTERGATRGDDRFSEAAMEDRKKEGYF